jgi:hypothetical protein
MRTRMALMACTYRSADGKNIVTKNALTLYFFFLTLTHRSVQVVNGRLI